MVAIKLCRKPEKCTFCKDKAFALITENPVCQYHLKRISTDLQISDEFSNFVHEYMQERSKNNLYNTSNEFTRERKRKTSAAYFYRKYLAPKRKSSLSPPLSTSSNSSSTSSRPGSPEARGE
jgi:hypothetical protein